MKIYLLEKNTMYFKKVPAAALSFRYSQGTTKSMRFLNAQPVYFLSGWSKRLEVVPEVA